MSLQYDDKTNFVVGLIVIFLMIVMIFTVHYSMISLNSQGNPPKEEVVVRSIFKKGLQYSK